MHSLVEVEMQMFNRYYLQQIENKFLFHLFYYSNLNNYYIRTSSHIICFSFIKKM